MQFNYLWLSAAMAAAASAATAAAAAAAVAARLLSPARFLPSCLAEHSSLASQDNCAC